MDNPIRYEDLFNENVLKGVTALKDELTSVKNELLSMINQAKAAAKSLGAELAKENGATKAKDIEEVKKAYDKMGVTLEGVTGQLEKLDGATEAIGLSQKEMNKVVKLGNGFNTERAESYAQLSKKYQAMKIIINQLTEEERKNNAEAKAMVEESKRIYDQMNMMQQATGKFQLQVGQYNKALNGLQLATNQVIRETPVLAQSASMFIMAISNNIPILVDEIKKFNEAQRAAAKAGQATISVGKAIIKTIFSWQTALIALLTVLPGLLRNMKKQKEEQSELIKSLSKMVYWQDAYFNGMQNGRRNYIAEVGELKVLNNITRDYNRTMDERIAAANKMKELYPDIFANFSAEEIAVGKAETAYRNFTATLLRHAEARAQVDKIIELEKKKLDVEEEARAKTDEALRNKQEKHNKYVFDSKFWDVFFRNRRIKIIKNWEEEVQMIQEWQEEQFANIDAAERRLLKKINPEDLVEDEKTTGGSTRLAKEKKIKNRDLEFVRAAEKARIEAMEEGKQKEIALIHNKYWVMREDLQNYLREQEKLPEKEREITKDGVDAINEQIKNLNLQEMRDLLALLGQAEDKSKKAKAGVASEKAVYKEHLDLLKKQWDTMNQQDIVRFKNDKREKRELLDNEIWYWQEYRKILQKYMPDGKEKDVLLGNAEAHEESARSKKRETDPNTFMGWIGLWTDENYEKKFEKGVERAYNIALEYMQKWMDARMEMAKEAVEAAQMEVDAAKEALDLEQQARVNGYAHNVGLARKEYEEKLALKQKALEEEQRIAAIQQKLDETQQISSLLVATANIWAAYTKGNIAGAVLAGLATAAMWGSFAAAKVQSAQLVKTKQYGEGMSEYLDYGGSHASGNDIDFGVMKDGTRRRVERGEMVAVINKKNVAKYGVDGVTDIVSSLNSGTFDEKYGLAFAGLGLMNASADLTKVEKGIDTLVSQGEKRIVQGNGCRVEYYKNRKRIIRN